MNQDWQNFLASQNARIQDGVVMDFGDAAAERNATRDGIVLCDLSQFGILKVTGDDAQSFLQNLLSNDIREVNGSHAQLSSFNNAKGRMLASMLIWRDSSCDTLLAKPADCGSNCQATPSAPEGSTPPCRGGNDYHLQLPRALCEAIRKKLSMYVLRSKVKVSDVSDEMVCIGISGAQAQATLQALYPTLPRQSMEVIQHDADFVMCREAQRFQIATTAQRASVLWQALSKAAKPVGSSCWDGLDIRAGVPFVQPATQEAFVPQMLNFEIIGGVNFKKGCYPGQEVVARMHYLGKAKRRMFLAHVEGDVAPHAGDDLFSAEMEGQSCGTVVSAVAAAQGGYDLLAVVQIASHDAFPVHLGSLTGDRLQFLPLPYSLP